MKLEIIITIMITIITTIFIGLYGASLFVGIASMNQFRIVLIVIGAIFIALVYAVVHNMLQRIREIKEENEDDLSKY